MAQALTKLKFTYGDYEKLPSDGKQYQILDGELFMTPAPFSKHQIVKKKKSEVIFVPDQPGVAIVEKDEVYPDVKDDMLPKFKKKNKKTLWIVGIALAGAGFALLSKKESKGTLPEPTIAPPPLPPN